ncbi:hypothetical protein [Amycolatopsis sp. CA-128772]|uniref:hypothetical protein n=1 Tax=Amycolatopsis sp. CA-128772 TaxID=2073159 RepID=UPI0011B0F1EA|nr:hypothetical protein [Amycolatopsis sp. CA-128772]
MSSNDRARKRAIRAEMAASGQNYTRAAHAVSVRPAHHLRAVCFGCEKDVPPGKGVVHISHREVNRVLEAQDAANKRQAERAEAEGRTGLAAKMLTMGDLRDEPEEARWQVHCDDCNPHDDDCDNCYWFYVERCSTWAQLADWTAHLSEKDWVLQATNWMQFIRQTAHGAKVGLVCHPEDRYKDA